MGSIMLSDGSVVLLIVAVSFAVVSLCVTASLIILARRRKDKEIEAAVEIRGIRDELLRSMETLRTATDNAARLNSEIGATLEAHIKGVRDGAELLGRKAEGLERALAGGGKQQGVWGESVLAHLLEASGLRKDLDYRLQKGTPQVGIPDAEVIDPAGRVIVIDSKTSLTAYLAYCNCREGDNDERAKYLSEHLRSVKKHIQELSDKNYIGRLQAANPEQSYIKLVAMFVPSESAHAAAMAADPTLAQYAFERGVAIVTPLTLFSYLKLVSLAWQQESIEKNHLQIIAKAELMLKRIDGAAKELEDMGAALKKASDHYEKMMGLLGKREGALSIVKPAEDLIALGVKLDNAKSRLQRPSI